MNARHPVLVRWIIAVLAPFVAFDGCAGPQQEARMRSPYRAFIAYWPPPKGSQRLRLAVKDLIDVKGSVTTAGCHYIAETSPAAVRDAACLAIAREEPVDFVGKTNLSELAVAPSGVNSYYGTPRNPITRRGRRIPGGSSGGSAVAVATGMADVALGTDTAGSVRFPAACCGVVGLKTTFGLVPLKGVYAVEAEHLDTVGPLAKDVAHTVEGMALLQRGFVERYRAAEAAKPSASQIRIGRLYLSGTDPDIDRAVDAALYATGFQVVPQGKTLTDAWDQAAKDATVVAASGAWMSDLKFRDKKDVTLRTKAIVALGGLNYKTDYEQALSRRLEWQETLGNVFKTVDFVALPTMQKLPPKVPFFGVSPLFETQALALQNTSPVNLAGNPALAVPIPVNEATDRAIPLTSLELIGPRFSEAGLLNAGRLVEAKRAEIARLLAGDRSPQKR